MSNFVYPAALPGLTYNSVRSPNFNTGIQQALTGKESRMAYQQYVLMQWELQYELLRDYVSPSDLKALVGLFIACQGKWDTFLYIDPVFNSVLNMPFGITDGSTTNFPVTATYENTGGPGGAELIQNFNQISGPPQFEINRYSQLIEYLDCGNPRTQFYIESDTFSVSALSNCTLATSGFATPDGVTGAIAMVSSTSSAVQHYVGQGFASMAPTVCCFSFFVLAHGIAGGGDARYMWIQINDSGGGVMQACFDITQNAGAVVSATVITGGNLVGPVPEIAACGSYFRVSLAFTKNGTSSPSCYIMPSSSGATTVYAGTSGNAGAFITMAQFENQAQFPGYGAGAGGAWPSMYLPTTTAAVTRADAQFQTNGVGVLTLGAGLAASTGVTLEWSGDFYYRCRFDDDNMDVSQFMQNFWELKKVKLRQVKL